MRKWIFLFLGIVAIISAGAQAPVISFVVSTDTVSEKIGTYNIAVFPSNSDTVPVSIDINVTGGNAVYGTNFTYSPVTITFPAGGQLTREFTVTVIDDSIPDGDKFVTFSLANPTNNATIGAISQHTLVIRDADTPVITISPLSATQTEAVGTVNVSASLNPGVRGATSVQVKLMPEGTTAVKGVDFIFNDTTLVWPPDSAGIQNAVIGVIYNQFYEHDRTVQLRFTGATNGAILTDTVFKLTILANQGFTQPGCSDLFFGQYVQGTGNNQALQIYNPAAVPIDMGTYSVVKSVNGGASMSAFNLSGTIAPHGVYIVANPSAASGILNVANAVSSFFNFDGTDALALLHLTDTLDIIGKLYVYPGVSGWSVNTGYTKQNTLIRNYFDHAGDTSWTTAAPSWNVFPVDMIDSLSFHHSDACNGGSPVATVRFLRPSDTIEQIDTFVDFIIMEVNNPTGSNAFFVLADDQNLSTAVEGYANDYHYSNRGYNAPPGLSYDTVLHLEVLPSAAISPTKTIVFRFIDLSANMVAIPDSIYTLYLTNHNKLVTSFLGAGYSYPKGSGLVKIPVVMSTFSSQPTTVDVTLSTGSAVLGQDFLFTDTTVTFPAFSSDTQGVWVTIFNNNVYEANRQANFNLSNPTNGAMLGITGFTLTIINNDSLAGGVANMGLSDGMKLYPNPVADKLMIQTDDEITKLEITDILGNRITDLGMLRKGTGSIDVSSLHSGVYILSVKKGEQFFNKRFVKTE